jgi:hypothetical protein
MNLHSVLKEGYKSKNKDNLNGYVLDRKLSDHNNKIYYDPTNKKLLHNVVGSHNLSDWVNNAKLAIGFGFKESKRYKDSHKKLRQAKEKYGINDATVVGHSQGGFTASNIASKNDKVITFNKAAVGQTIKKNERAYRTDDLVSVLNARSKHMTNLPSVSKSGILPLDLYKNHNVDAIKNNKIFI